MKKQLVIGIVMTLVIAAVAIVPTPIAHTEDDPDVRILYAGQDIDVGNVYVWNDENNIYVKYELSQDAIDEGWCITETHVHVGEELSDFPLNKGGNPQVGLFDYSEDHDPCVTEYTYEIELTWAPETEIIIATHAVIEKEVCELLAEAPYTAAEVTDFDQGVRKDGTPVRVGRSNPDAVLTYDLGQDETNFFSLGFKFDEGGVALDEGGWIIIEFEYPIINGPGDDIMVVEDTWGTYPLETADVYASQDGVTWVFLGTADNTERTVNNIHTEAYFDLEDVGMDWAKFIKVVDTTPIGPMPTDGDGYDLNTVVALHDYIECTTYDETAWADGTRFTEQGNWATYFTYTIQEPPPQCDWVFVETVTVYPDGTLYSSTNVLESGVEYLLEASGTFSYNSAGDWADAEWYLKNGVIVKGDTEGSVPYVLDISINGYVSNIDWGDYNPEHVYYHVYTGTDSIVDFFIYDSFYGDNSGSLTVDIYEWQCI